MQTIGEILKSARLALELDVIDVAKATGLTVEMLVSVENGSSPVQADSLYALVNFLNIAPEDVITFMEARHWTCSTDEDVEALFRKQVL
ncbi:MAG: XRE family transcriptional regulator [Proteobacteria bacterium]|nr:MAG: XRE family transcriptional regulator [Pseudomonadota bacterium]